MRRLQLLGMNLDEMAENRDGWKTLVHGLNPAKDEGH